jgi:hypothetical protein
MSEFSRSCRPMLLILGLPPRSEGRLAVAIRGMSGYGMSALKDPKRALFKVRRALFPGELRVVRDCEQRNVKEPDSTAMRIGKIVASDGLIER